MLDKVQVNLPIKNKQILTAFGNIKLKHAKDKRWDIVNALCKSMEEDIWSQYKKIKGRKAILCDHYKIESFKYPDDPYLHFTMSIQVGTLDI